MDHLIHKLFIVAKVISGPRPHFYKHRIYVVFYRWKYGLAKERERERETLSVYVYTHKVNATSFLFMRWPTGYSKGNLNREGQYYYCGRSRGWERNYLLVFSVLLSRTGKGKFHNEGGEGSILMLRRIKEPSSHRSDAESAALSR